MSVSTPAGTIGILGGGQLGRMLAMAAARLGYRTCILDPDPQAPAAQLADRHFVASFDDANALAAFAETCDVITFEFENIPLEAIDLLATRKPVFPPRTALKYSQDRLLEKDFINSIGLATAPYAGVSSREELGAALAANGGRGILKTRCLGYDGKGQVMITSLEQAGAAFALLGAQPLVMEGIVDFEMELSVIAVRGQNGEFRAYDPPSNSHREGILRTSSVPSQLEGEILAQAIAIARRIAVALDYVGVLAVELFLTRDGQLLVNEIAPRVHNSGHWTEAACAISQFEQHIRAVCGLALGDTTRHSDCLMENLIGEDVARLPALLATANAVLHLYGKKQVRPGRKMGHFTTLYPSDGPGPAPRTNAVDIAG